METILNNIRPGLIIPVLFVVLFIGVFISITFFSDKKKIIRQLKQLPDIRSISGLRQNEFVKITGKAVSIEEAFIAPLTKRKCVFYILKIEQQKTRGKNNYWKTIVNEEKIQDFFVEKNGDKIMINPRQSPKNYKSYLTIDKKITSTSKEFQDSSAELDAVLTAYGISKRAFLGFDKSLRLTEAIVEVGENVTVAGVGTLKSLHKAIPGYSYSKIASLTGETKKKLIITDLKSNKGNRRRL